MLSVMYQSLTHYNVTLFPRHSACHHRDIWLFSYRAVSRRDSPASRVPTMEIMEIMEMIVNIIFTEMDYSCDRNFSRRAMKLRLTNGHKEINCTDIYCYTEDENSSDSDRDMDVSINIIDEEVDCEESFICSDSKSSESNCSSSKTDSSNSDLIYSSENYILDDSSEHLRDTSRKCIPTSSQLIIPLESDDFLLERSSEVLEVDTVDISSEELEIKLNTIVEKPICNS